MKFATLGHLITEQTKAQLPPEWFTETMIISPQIEILGTPGYITGIPLTSQQMMTLPKHHVRETIYKAAIHLQKALDVDVIQLGGLTTSVTAGGSWLAEQNGLTAYINHGDSYTAAITCHVINRVLQDLKKKPKDLTLSIIGAYGIIGEAVSKILVPQFQHTTLIGRRKEPFEKLTGTLTGSFDTTTQLEPQHADIIITATNHPTALLQSSHIKNNGIVVDVSQPPNLSADVCAHRPDILRIDGGYVSIADKTNIQFPGMPAGMLFACVVEGIMQAMENDCHHHVGSINLTHLQQTETWGQKYGFTLQALTNFGQPIQIKGTEHET